MTLTLTMLRCPDAVPPQTRTIAGGEFSIGRGPDNDWVLSDPERVLSKCHCVFAYRSGSWQIADLSTNGSFLNRDGEPIGRGQVRDLRDGDRLHLGPYEIEIRVAESAVEHVPASNPFVTDIFAQSPARGAARPDPGLRLDSDRDPFAVNLSPPAITLPPDFDPLAPDAPDEFPIGPTQADHSPHLEDAFIAPAAHSVLPDDWDREAPPRLNTSAPAAAPVRVAPPLMPPQPAEVARPPMPQQAPAVATRMPLATEPIAAPSADLQQAFFRGCGISNVSPPDAPAAFEALGAAFRAVVSGLRQAMIARAAIKGEFRIEQTMIRSRGNNPLKFSANDDDALTALLDAGRRTEMSAVDAVTDALRDIRLHEVATFAAMQAAMRSLLDELDPAKLRRAADRGALDFLPAQRKAHAWDEFEVLYEKIRRALEDDFDSVFGKAFARAYERALGEASAREPRG